jgi:hypothetical protein
MASFLAAGWHADADSHVALCLSALALAVSQSGLYVGCTLLPGWMGLETRSVVGTEKTEAAESGKRKARGTSSSANSLKR